MKFVSFVFLAAFFASQGVFAHWNDARANTVRAKTLQRIINGEVVLATDEVAKHTVAVLSEIDIPGGTQGLALCSGVIIDDQTVLTAAHCLPSAEEFQQVLSGQGSLSINAVFGTNLNEVFASKADALRPVVSFRILVQVFDMQTDGVAVLHFDGKMPKGYSAIPIADQGSKIPTDSSLVVAGYGLTNAVMPSDEFTGVLNKTSVKTVDSGKITRREKQISVFADKDEILVDERATGTCEGDSGGPAFFDGKVVALTRAGTTDQCNEYGVLIDLGAFHDQIVSMQKEIAEEIAAAKKAAEAKAAAEPAALAPAAPVAPVAPVPVVPAPTGKPQVVQ